MRDPSQRRPRVRCPRCRVKLSRRDIARHLWNQHHLVLDGRKARTTWQLLDVELGRLDPAAALVRVHRRVLAHGLRDEDALEHLQTQAAKLGASLCPHCWAVVPGSHDRPALEPLFETSGRLAADGYSVEIKESGLVQRLLFVTASGRVFAGREPGRWLTRRAARMLTGGLSLILPATVSLVHPVLGLILAVGLLPLLLFVLWTFAFDPRPRRESIDRLIDYAWTKFIPRLHADGFCLADARFIGRLALTSMDRGDRKTRDGQLDRLTDLTTEAVRTGRAGSIHLAPLNLLTADDARAAGRDPVLMLANRAQQCLTGEATLAVVEALLADGFLDRWPPADRERFRILLTARAFGVGWEVWDLVELGRAVPFIGRALGTEDIDGLARLRLLWKLRPDRPWHRCGPAVTVFDLAGYPVLGGQHLETTPDLLLYQPLTNMPRESGPPVPILVCGRGVRYADVLLREPPGSIGVRLRPLWQGGGYELVTGPYRLHFRDDPDALARRLEKWANYFFSQFLPRADEVMAWRSTGHLGPLLRQRTISCPDCSHSFIARRGMDGLPAGDQ